MWPFTDTRSIDVLIFEYAEHHRARDYRALIRVLKRTELFAPIVAGARDLPNGAQYTVREEDNIALGHVEYEGYNFTAFFTNRHHPKLPYPCAGMSGIQAMEIVAANDRAHGMMVQNNAGSYIGLLREDVRRALEIG